MRIRAPRTGVALRIRCCAPKDDHSLASSAIERLSFGVRARGNCEPVRAKKGGRFFRPPFRSNPGTPGSEIVAQRELEGARHADAHFLPEGGSRGLTRAPAG